MIIKAIFFILSAVYIPPGLSQDEVTTYPVSDEYYGTTAEPFDYRDFIVPKRNCGSNLVASSSISVLESTGYPESYEDNLNCTWRITAPEGSRVRLEIEDFETEACCDSVQIIGADTGPRTLRGEVLSQVIHSQNNVLTLVFNTDLMVSKKGFRMTYIADDASQDERENEDKGEKKCGGLLKATPEHNIFTSPNFPNEYPSNSNCWWTIRAPNPQLSVVLQFFEMDTEACCDYLRIYEGKKEIKRLRGTSKYRLTSRGSSFRVHFISDKSVNGKGFQARYYTIDKSETTTKRRTTTTTTSTTTTIQPLTSIADEAGCGYTTFATDDKQLVTTPGWPRDYATDLRCLWTLRAPADRQMMLKINLVRTEACCDYLEIFDGKTWLPKMKGNILSPTIYNSTNGLLKLRFYSDSTVVSGGFEAEYILLPKTKTNVDPVIEITTTTTTEKVTTARPTTTTTTTTRPTTTTTTTAKSTTTTTTTARPTTTTTTEKPTTITTTTAKPTTATTTTARPTTTTTTVKPTTITTTTTTTTAKPKTTVKPTTTTITSKLVTSKRTTTEEFATTKPKQKAKRTTTSRPKATTIGTTTTETFSAIPQTKVVVIPVPTKNSRNISSTKPLQRNKVKATDNPTTTKTPARGKATKTTASLSIDVSKSNSGKMNPVKTFENVSPETTEATSSIVESTPITTKSTFTSENKDKQNITQKPHKNKASKPNKSTSKVTPSMGSVDAGVVTTTETSSPSSTTGRVSSKITRSTTNYPKTTQKVRPTKPSRTTKSPQHKPVTKESIRKNPKIITVETKMKLNLTVNDNDLRNVTMAEEVLTTTIPDEDLTSTMPLESISTMELSTTSVPSTTTHKVAQTTITTEKLTMATKPTKMPKTITPKMKPTQEQVKSICGKLHITPNSTWTPISMELNDTDLVTLVGKCKWLINATKGSIVEIKAENFKLFQSSRLEILNANGPSFNWQRGRLIKSFHMRTAKDFQYLTELPLVGVQLSFYEGMKPVQLFYRSIQRKENKCELEEFAITKPRRLVTPGWPYPVPNSEISCTWKIKAPDGDRVELIVVQLFTDKESNDSLQIYEGEELITTLTDRKTNVVLTSNSSQFELRFFSKSDLVRRGMLITYRIASLTTTITTTTTQQTSIPTTATTTTEKPKTIKAVVSELDFDVSRRRMIISRKFVPSTTIPSTRAETTTTTKATSPELTTASDDEITSSNLSYLGTTQTIDIASNITESIKDLTTTTTTALEYTTESLPTTTTTVYEGLIDPTEPIIESQETTTPEAGTLDTNADIRFFEMTTISSETEVPTVDNLGRSLDTTVFQESSTVLPNLYCMEMVASIENGEMFVDKMEQMECPPFSKCMLLAADTEIPGGIKSKTIYGMCVHQSLCNKEEVCHTILTNQNAAIGDLVRIESCNISCCEDDLCNEQLLKIHEEETKDDYDGDYLLESRMEFPADDALQCIFGSGSNDVIQCPPDTSCMTATAEIIDPVTFEKNQVYYRDCLPTIACTLLSTCDSMAESLFGAEVVQQMTSCTTSCCTESLCNNETISENTNTLEATTEEIVPTVPDATTTNVPVATTTQALEKNIESSDIFPQCTISSLLTRSWSCATLVLNGYPHKVATKCRRYAGYYYDCMKNVVDNCQREEEYVKKMNVQEKNQAKKLQREVLNFLKVLSFDWSIDSMCGEASGDVTKAAEAAENLYKVCDSEYTFNLTVKLTEVIDSIKTEQQSKLCKSFKELKSWMLENTSANCRNKTYFDDMLNSLKLLDIPRCLALEYSTKTELSEHSVLKPKRRMPT